MKKQNKIPLKKERTRTGRRKTFVFGRFPRKSLFFDRFVFIEEQIHDETFLRTEKKKNEQLDLFFSMENKEKLKS